MSEIKNDEYIEISLIKILVGLFINIKTFLVVLVLGCCLTAIAAWLFKPSYSYLQMIQPPYYLNGYSANSIISDNKLNVILN
ncbi:Wzz/FepE/Etk N-terminal domain-containing protein, partial [Francisella tularensis]|uniref:Wzz/FepE/Etk N-terminal domain-containing protein n=1 Tax=Francisella tularensis TaxID=263 RepID=UPI002381A6AF